MKYESAQSELTESGLTRVPLTRAPLENTQSKDNQNTSSTRCSAASQTKQTKSAIKGLTGAIDHPDTAALPADTPVNAISLMNELIAETAPDVKSLIEELFREQRCK
ncbi:hypothetical protein FKG94_00435 [Exilibacterium tricleocarpae]|uniref:Uncharacterized protein n=1 Tax=Exilibacterium tricleocarpae TaxID=2591008 RepID=A0A545U9B5_9GAMM|nr:hypothetical protein [Exilibacterium tricleocarpae]TQV86062.1 hypothetical protein FKG94_00435 [Exilibacterium tricleocarpae]